MKFALVGGERRQPEPTLTGQCPGCGETVTAKCGTQRVWHWAHKGLRTCDPWWEPETEWHRRWKNLFPVSWQETVLRSETTGERHIADVRTPNGLVMEFQHSAINPAELASRETFYQNMIWIVDCKRLGRDRPRIDENLTNWRSLPEGDVRMSHWPDEFLPKRWLDCSVPVLFDFDGLDIDDHSDRHNHLICLLPDRFMDEAVYFPVERSTLVSIANNEALIFDRRTVHQRLLESKMQARTASYRLRAPDRRGRY
ncbi:competence protein CoiA family protein [Mesorhizobium sp. M0437]|uniref:competence protein CoiA n=1 Tax=Mesorhizobium sp. M0437 TaxID=2956945 RepID=UPI003334BE4B